MELAPPVRRRRVQQSSLSQSVPQTNGVAASNTSPEPVNAAADGDGRGDSDGENDGTVAGAPDREAT